MGGALCNTGITREKVASVARFARQLCKCWDELEEERGAIMNGLFMLAILCCGAISQQ